MEPEYKRIRGEEYKRFFRVVRVKEKFNGGKIVVGNMYVINKIPKAKTTILYSFPIDSVSPESKELIDKALNEWDKRFIMRGDELYRYLTNKERREYKVLLNANTLYIVNNKKFTLKNTSTGFYGYLEPVLEYKSFAPSGSLDTFKDIMGVL